MSAPNTAVEEREDVTPTSSRSPKTTALIVKIILVGLVDALLILAFAKSVSADWWLAAVFFAAVFVAVNFVYFTGRALPFKYLLPGLVFLVAFQFYTMVFTGYASFTNYGGNHLGDKDDGDHVDPGRRTWCRSPVARRTRSCRSSRTARSRCWSPTPRPGSPASAPTRGSPRSTTATLVKDGDTVTGVNGYESLNLGSFANNPDYDKQWKELAVPFDEEEGTYLRSKSVTQALAGHRRLRLRRGPGRDGLHDRGRRGLPGRRRQGQLHQRGG